MIEIGILHNGASDLPAIKTPSGVTVHDGSLEEVHESNQRVLISQVRQGILAERLGYDYYFMTEHHFEQEGAEFSPSPLLAQTAIAAQTKRIRLGQMANIISWWHPIRIAEQAAMLDVISGGRLEFGIGRGTQPREAELFGATYGSGVQDQERNRSYFYEAFEVILRAWTETSFSHHGEFYTLPPSFTKWHHHSTMAYFGQEKAGRKPEDVLKMGKPDLYSGGPPVMAATTTLKEISVFPQPLQKPYPQVWIPVTSERTIRWAAQQKINAYTVPEPLSRLKRNIEIYYEEAEKNNWPDRLDRGAFKYGWDAEKHRGFGCCRYVHIIPEGKDEQKRIDRYKASLEQVWDYLSPFGFAIVLSDLDEAPYDIGMKVPADLLINKDIAIVGTADHVTEKLMKLKTDCGYEDFFISAWFEGAGYSTEETEENMEMFAEGVMPELRNQCGGGPSLPESTVTLVP